ncbi:uncharacterized protein [Nicotiana tomentosiformis]|uniref:uncharacterized protein n=1 Tax=Nicotiana tomentosiformis TaxID=4098 RepID=UPI00388CB17E
MEGEKVLLRVSPMKGVMRFGKKGKLNLRFIGLFEVLDRVGEVAYSLVLPPRLARVHLVLHVSMLRKYHENRSYVLDFSTMQLDENLTYEEELVTILDQQVQKLISKDIPFVKVCWRAQPTEEATWEYVSDIRSRYPNIVTSPDSGGLEARVGLLILSWKEVILNVEE